MASSSRRLTATAVPIALLAAALLGCSSDPLVAPPPFVAAPAVGLDAGARTALHRLTAAEWRNAAEDLTGLRWNGTVPADFILHGYSSVGAAEVTVAPVDLEVLEAAAWGLADALLPDDADPGAWLGCTSDPPLGAEDLGAPALPPCLRAALTPWLARAFRRPASRADVTRWIALYDEVVADSGSSLLAARAIVAATLLAPDFLFRVEFGLPLPGEAELRLLDPHEQAARLAFSLTDRPPDPALATAAALDGLATPAQIAAVAGALLAGDDAFGSLTAFFTEWTDLGRLWLVTKDAALHPEWTPALREAMAVEAQLLFQSVALEEDADLRTLFTTTEARITPDLAALYGVAPPGSPLEPITLPSERAGLLTRGAFLAAFAHAATTSPTLRGKYVRTRLLCSDVPPPPPGVVTSLDGTDDSGTLREQLEAHRIDPQCSSCHVQMDPIGFAFEHFDPVGAWRTLDRGFPVDSATDLDGVDVDGGAAFGAALAAHDRLPRCLSANAFAHLLGHIEQRVERGQIGEVTESLESGGHRLSALVPAIASTLAFRTVGVPDGGRCESVEEGASRSCATACGDGVETCVAGAWVGCSAPRPVAESCNGIDDDCDGGIDDDVIVACEGGGRPGSAGCVGGVLTGCEAVLAAESCNGLDDDGDGVADDDLAVEIAALSAQALVDQHSGCDPMSAPHTDNCRAATHRLCAARGCATTGLGPVAWDELGERVAVACLAPEEAQVIGTTYTVLGASHGGCTQALGFGPACNAAINRWCGSQGLGTGYGPVEHSGEVAVVACTPGATVLETSYTELSAYNGACSAGGQRMGADCDEAFHRLCRARGHRTGHGPLENSGDLAYVACIGVLP